MKRISVFGLSIVCLSFALVCMAGTGSTTIPAADLKKQMQIEAKLIQEMLAKGTVDEKTNKKTRAVAMLIAGYGSLAKDHSVSDSALKLVAAMDKDKVAEAKAVAATLAGDAKPGSASKSPPLNKAVDFEIVMRVFSRLGLALERELDEMMELKSFNAEHFDKLTILGQRLAGIGELATHFVPEKDEPKKPRKTWLQLSGDLRDNATNLAAAAKAKKQGEITKQLERIGMSCRKCHEIFRDAE